MATNITDAYLLVLDKEENSLAKLMNITQEIKVNAFELFKENYTKDIAKWVQHRKDLCGYFGDKVFDLVQDDDIVKQLKLILEGNYNETFLFLNESIIYNKTIQDFLPNMYEGKVVYIPCEDNILMVYFGDRKYIPIIESSGYFKEFQYQNHIDKPNNITEQEWNYRKECWAKALAPDFIPYNHGFSFKFIDLNDIVLQTNLFFDGELLDSAIEYAKKQYEDRIAYIYAILESSYDLPDFNNPSKDTCKQINEYQIWKANIMDDIRRKLEL